MYEFVLDVVILATGVAVLIGILFPRVRKKGWHAVRPRSHHALHH